VAVFGFRRYASERQRYALKVFDRVVAPHELFQLVVFLVGSSSAVPGITALILSDRL
jgi:hypothetical protein